MNKRERKKERRWKTREKYKKVQQRGRRERS